jgi:hypothetical protein
VLELYSTPVSVALSEHVLELSSSSRSVSCLGPIRYVNFLVAGSLKSVCFVIVDMLTRIIRFVGYCTVILPIPVPNCLWHTFKNSAL